MSTDIVVQAELDGARDGSGAIFPLTLSPSAPPVATAALIQWIAGNRHELLDMAKDHGAVLLRGFAVASPDEFGQVVEALGLDNMPYIGGAAVRNKVSGERVLTANESPSSEPIPFHHEMSQVPHPPDYVVFYCDIPPASGGETPIVLSSRIYELAQTRCPGFLAKVEELGVRYRRIMPERDDPTSAIGRSWKSTYQAETQAEAEAAMRAQETTFTWLPDGNLETLTAALPAIRVEPRTGKKTFFNSMIAAYTGWVDSRNDPRNAVVLGDGSPVDHDAMMAIVDIMRTERAVFTWHESDILIIDNRLTMHSRNPFEPPRRILASVARAPR